MTAPSRETSGVQGSSPAALSVVQRLAEDLEGTTLVLPAFPDSVARVQAALQSEGNSTEEVVQVLSSEPGLAARILQVANAWIIRRSGAKITDLTQAVNRMGYSMVRSITVAFGMRRFQGSDSYSPEQEQDLKATIAEAVNVAATASVLAQHYTKIKKGDALLTGLLHVMGRLYIIKQASDFGQISSEEMKEIYDQWHATIGKAIADSWGLPEEMGEAIEQQEGDGLTTPGPVTLSDILVAAKLAASGEKPEGFDDPDNQSLHVFHKLGIATCMDDLEIALETHEEEIEQLRKSLTP
ncbi:MAG: HDOD domain-containing protein [Gammaproteobacteria bacterium]